MLNDFNLFNTNEKTWNDFFVGKIVSNIFHNNDFYDLNPIGRVEHIKLNLSPLSPFDKILLQTTRSNSKELILDREKSVVHEKIKSIIVTFKPISVIFHNDWTYEDVIFSKKSLQKEMDCKFNIVNESKTDFLHMVDQMSKLNQELSKHLNEYTKNMHKIVNQF